MLQTLKLNSENRKTKFGSTDSRNFNNPYQKFDCEMFKCRMNAGWGFLNGFFAVAGCKVLNLDKECNVHPQHQDDQRNQHNGYTTHLNHFKLILMVSLGVLLCEFFLKHQFGDPIKSQKKLRLLH